MSLNKGQIQLLTRRLNDREVTKRLMKSILTWQRKFEKETRRVASIQSMNVSRQIRSNVRPRNIRYVQPNRRRNSSVLANSGKRWTNADVQLSVFLFLVQRSTFASIGRRLGRTETAVLNMVNLVRRAFKEGTVEGNPLTYRGSYLNLIKEQKRKEQRRTQLRRNS